jgi:hypothetical protein
MEASSTPLTAADIRANSIADSTKKQYVFAIRRFLAWLYSEYESAGQQVLTPEVRQKPLASIKKLKALSEIQEFPFGESFTLDHFDKYVTHLFRDEELQPSSIHTVQPSSISINTTISNFLLNGMQGSRNFYRE